jgi:hypothetical protein
VPLGTEADQLLGVVQIGPATIIFAIELSLVHEHPLRSEAPRPGGNSGGLFYS